MKSINLLLGVFIKTNVVVCGIRFDVTMLDWRPCILFLANSTWKTFDCLILWRCLNAWLLHLVHLLSCDVARLGAVSLFR